MEKYVYELKEVDYDGNCIDCWLHPYGLMCSSVCSEGSKFKLISKKLKIDTNMVHMGEDDVANVLTLPSGKYMFTILKDCKLCVGSLIVFDGWVYKVSKVVELDKCVFSVVTDLVK